MWFRVSCSSGTYIRSLVSDLGDQLGCGAFLAGLTRRRLGAWQEEDAHSVQTVTREHWRGLEDVLRHEPRLDVDASEAKLLSQGLRVPIEADVPGNPPWVVWSEGQVCGLAELKAEEAQAKRWLSREFLSRQNAIGESSGESARESS